MAQHMTTILQDMLLVAPIDGSKSQFPSPEVSKATPSTFCTLKVGEKRSVFLLGANWGTSGNYAC